MKHRHKLQSQKGDLLKLADLTFKAPLTKLIYTERKKFSHFVLEYRFLQIE